MGAENSGREPVNHTGDKVTVAVKLVPNASRDEIVGFHGDRIRIRVTAPPERGKANTALCRLLRSVTGAATATVTTGVSNANKTVALTGVTGETVRDRLRASMV